MFRHARSFGVDTAPFVPARHALEELFDREFDTIFKFALARSGDRETADEVAADVFLAAAQALESGAEESIGLPWLYVVARRRLIDIWRRQEREQNRLKRLIDYDRRNQEGEVDDRYPSEHSENRALRALQKLPERQRAAITLRYLDGFSVSEIARVMGVEYKAAESLLSRGRRSFMDAWENQ